MSDNRFIMINVDPETGLELNKSWFEIRTPHTFMGCDMFISDSIPDDTVLMFNQEIEAKFPKDVTQ